MKYPCSLDRLLNYVPHRAPMEWIDAITMSEAKACSARVTLNGNGHYFEELGLRASSCIEFIAQAYGYGSACYKLSLNPETPPVLRAFLASFKDVVFADPSVFKQIQGGDELKIEVTGVRQKGPITSFQGRVLKENIELCRADLRVFTSTEN